MKTSLTPFQLESSGFAMISTLQITFSQYTHHKLCVESVDKYINQLASNIDEATSWGNAGADFPT